MSNSIAASSPAQTAVKRETIVDFSPEALQAPFLLRFGSLLIDYMVLLILPVGSMIYAKAFGEPFTTMSDRTLWLVATLLFLANIIILPLIFGRSLGKLLTGLRVVRLDGTVPGRLAILIRQTLGYLITALTFGLGFLWCVFSSKGRTLHDYLTGTVVVQGRQRIV